jgi:hypothetical protein
MVLRHDAALTWGSDALICWPRIALAADPRSEGFDGVHPQPKRRRAVALHKDVTLSPHHERVADEDGIVQNTRPADDAEPVEAGSSLKVAAQCSSSPGSCSS